MKKLIMKKLTTSLFCLFIIISASSQSEKPRNWAQISAMKVKGKYDKNSARIFTQKGLPRWKEISLKNYEYTSLNKIEQDLLERYTDVVVSFTFNRDSIGISSITGEEVVPPVAGKIRFVDNLCVVGEQTSDFDIITDYANNQSVNSAHKVAYSFGLSKCILKFSPKGVQTVIPYGKYDFISVVPKGMGIRGLYVCKIFDDGSTLWGACDKDGKELIACEYKSIYFDGQSFVGDNEHSMEELQQRYEDKVHMRQELMQQRRQQWASALNAFGQAAITTGQAMQVVGVGGGSSDEVDADETGNGGSGDHGANYPGMSRSQLQSRYNAAIENIRRIKDSWAMHVGTYGEVAQRDNLRSVKKNIQSIKASAQKHGVSLQLNSLENWNP